MADDVLLVEDAPRDVLLLDGPVDELVVEGPGVRGPGGSGAEEPPVDLTVLFENSLL